MLIATHDGTFHADETLACAVLTYIFESSQIIRTRDRELMESADLIIDVSGINDERHYDHHSPDFNLARDNGIRYATAGLMWHKFGNEFLSRIVRDHPGFKLSAEAIPEAWKRLDREIMFMVDLNDNGQLNEYLDDVVHTKGAGERKVKNQLNEFYQIEPDIPYLVAMQNLPGVRNEEQDRNFLATVRLLRTFLVNAAINALSIEAGIAKVMEIYDGKELLIMHERLPWTQAVIKHFDRFAGCELAIYPDRKRGFRVQSLPLSREERFRNRLSAPRAWRGLNDAALDAATGLHGTIFVHRAGFTGGAYDFETCLALAKIWLREGERPRDPD